MSDRERDGFERISGDDLLAAIERRHATARLTMLRDVERLTRRDVLRRGGRFAAGAGAVAILAGAGFSLRPDRALAQDATPAAALPEISSIPDNLKGSGEVVVCSWGGAFQDAQREAYFKPFEQLSGIKVIEAEGPDTAKVKAMVDTGNVEWDVVQFDQSGVPNLAKKGDYWEPMDYSLFDTANIDPAHMQPLYVDMLPYAQILAYRTDVFPEAPQGWKDFWDTERFPGPRTMIAGSGGVNPFLEAALIADGVPPAEVYPINVDRAFESMDRIRDDVAKFWEAGAVPAQMLADKEAVMAVSWNGRIAAIQKQGVPAEIQWNEGMALTDVWAVPKGAKNKENAMKFCAFITRAEPQARLSMLIPYGSVNKMSMELLPPEVQKDLVTSPEIQAKLFPFNPQWWVDNADAVAERWNEWILG
ncbi:MAG: ABC transporter substrate-binding protein [Chloroflexota bacterium]|nr:ABC transporter substrate-binding protein [Chloroflexota bacterium]